ncbi:hypothetical protein [Methylobacterium sp. NEAU K]|uniref:hypothetical protein n=1 Tax=Methylobacterium sp. NEAU K TaxID=3064946 RepID=UPI0027373E48|nr:hypothetical protein [Methylobacterium sp. NEAU K]MDP4005460.1 hypothetical protein [Methylobacterium sp. NEAU K]
MPRYKRFGRGIPMPSTAAIKHGLKLMEATDILVSALHNEKCGPEEMDQIISDLGDRYGMPSETISALKGRFAAG